ncbi:hypothetical protein D8M04_12185 [Oceanobacillus piezotolerans]|uniref:YbxH family protein n=1 Tax=Oceanobacillus piezotolerans TaxID=2448030 RepID=A0A498D4B6_9BACI|nr:YbxH family protein [Oceanobacillus piezotolerans]RLL43676.1 hypothetical protein D8M04_12185 [Oceanobacillus piezotolerans]
MGAIERAEFRFEPEYSVIQQNGAIHVYKNGEFVEEVKFSFSGESPNLEELEKIVNEYCEDHDID